MLSSAAGPTRKWGRKTAALPGPSTYPDSVPDCAVEAAKTSHIVLLGLPYTVRDTTTICPCRASERAHKGKPFMDVS